MTMVGSCPRIVVLNEQPVLLVGEMSTEAGAETVSYAYNWELSTNTGAEQYTELVYRELFTDTGAETVSLSW